MYEAETILTLKEPRSTEDQEFAYDRVKVIGPSPINHGRLQDAEWTGTAGQGVIIQPLSGFGATLDEPFGKLQKLYDVESMPVHEGPVEAPIRVINTATAAAGQTPEEVFAVDAPGEASVDGKRVRTPHSPLDALVKDEDKPSSSPLGNVKPDEDE